MLSLNNPLLGGLGINFDFVGLAEVSLDDGGFVDSVHIAFLEFEFLLPGQHFLINAAGRNTNSHYIIILLIPLNAKIEFERRKVAYKILNPKNQLG